MTALTTAWTPNAAAGSNFTQTFTAAVSSFTPLLISSTSDTIDPLSPTVTVQTTASATQGFSQTAKDLTVSSASSNLYTALSSQNSTTNNATSTSLNYTNSYTGFKGNTVTGITQAQPLPSTVRVLLLNLSTFTRCTR